MEQNKKDIPIFVKIVIVLVLLLEGILLILPSVNNDNSTGTPQNKHFISKETFQGKWAFTVDTVELHHIDINGEMEGVEVDIDNKSYAITRNIEDREFLPDKYWKNAEFEAVGKYQVCSDTLIEDKCKVSMSDIIQYAEKLPLIKAY